MYRVDPRCLEGRYLERTIVADAEHKPSALQKTPCETLPVMPTSQLLELIESTAFDIINPCLEIGFRTVGVGIDIRHFAPTPADQQVTAKLTLHTVSGRKCTFSVDVRDEHEPVCAGTYESYVINSTRFKAAVERKRQMPTSMAEQGLQKACDSPPSG